MTQFPFTTAQVEAATRQTSHGPQLSYEMAMAVHSYRRANGMRALGSHTDAELVREALHWAGRG